MTIRHEATTLAGTATLRELLLRWQGRDAQASEFGTTRIGTTLSADGNRFRLSACQS